MSKAMRRCGLVLLCVLAGCEFDKEEPVLGHVASDASAGPSHAGSGGFGGGSGRGGSGGNSAGVSSSRAPGVAAPGTGSDAATAAMDDDAGIGPGMEPPVEQPIDRTPLSANPFVLAQYDPFSTFGADVDTASYDGFTRDVELGRLPSPANVRLEDFVNFFAYDYPAPAADAAQPFAISLAAMRSGGERKTTLLRVGIQAKQPPPSEKKRAHVVFLVDVSGSMSEELPLVKRVLDGAVGQLDAYDKISIVTYAGGTEVRLAPTAITDPQKIRTAIAALESGGSTNGAGGIQLAYAQAEAAFVQDGINHVVLCTDGDFNVGASSDEALVELIKEKRTTGITLTALGFGTERVNDSMMEKVSNAGNGSFSVVTSAAHADRYVAQRLLSTIVHVAKDMKLQVEFNPERVHAYRLLGYEDRAIADGDFRNDVVDAGEVGSGHRVTALYELILAGEPQPALDSEPVRRQADAASGPREVAASDLALVKVRYKAPGARSSDPASEVATGFAPDAIATDADGADADLRWAAAVAAFAEILKQSSFAQPETLAALELTFAAQQQRDEDRAAFVAQFRKARALLP